MSANYFARACKVPEYCEHFHFRNQFTHIH
jgi:hypothetical protein